MAQGIAVTPSDRRDLIVLDEHELGSRPVSWLGVAWPVAVWRDFYHAVPVGARLCLFDFVLLARKVFDIVWLLACARRVHAAARL